MQHRHIFVRNAMLWLAAVFWLFAAAAVATVASLVYNQVGGGLEGFDRVLGVLIPFVVRADLIVDWAKRVAWALLNMHIWTQSAVQTRRLIARAADMRCIVSAGDDTKILAPAVHVDFKNELLAAEHRVWTEDSHSLVTVRQVFDHFEKLSRVALYAFCVLILAIPGAIIWMIYATYHCIACLTTKSNHLLSLLYFISILLAPIGAAMLVLASAGMLCGVVSLSVVGTMIQFGVFWSLRIVFSVVRITLSQIWAGFPLLSNKSSISSLQHPIQSPTQQDMHHNSRRPSMTIRPRRVAEEAAAAMVIVGPLLPTELEFALASWDGKREGHKSKPLGFSLSKHLFSSSTDWLNAKQGNDDPLKSADRIDCDIQREQYAMSEFPSVPAPPPVARMAADRATTEDGSEKMEGLGIQSESVRNARGESGFHPLRPSWSDFGDIDDDLFTVDDSIGEATSTMAGVRRVLSSRTERQMQEMSKSNETTMALLNRLGLDLNVSSARQRRLSTFYSLGMLVHLQAESGGNAWCLNAIEDISEVEFNQRMKRFNSIVADEAHAAVIELCSRLHAASKYRVIPTGAPVNRMVPVQVWLRAVLLAFLENAGDGERNSRLEMGEVGPGPSVLI